MEIIEIKNILEGQGRAFEEFKKANDALIAAKAEGKAVGDLTAKVETLSKELDRLDQLKAVVDEMQKKAACLAIESGGNKSATDQAEEARQFNVQRKSFFTAGGRQAPSDLDVDTYRAYKSAFFGMVAGRQPSLDEQKALLAGSDPDGGYLLPTPTVGRVVQRVYETSPIRQIASVQNISTDALEGINDLDEAAAGWVSETGTRSDSNTPQVGKWRIEAHEMYAMPKATQKLLDDAAVDIEGWLAMKVADKFARLENAAFISGTGVGQPRGFAAYTTAATADASRTWGQLEHVKSGANGAFASSNPADKLFDLIGAFKQHFLANARFVTTREVITAIRKFKEATTNAYMWQPGLQPGQPDSLLGYPITIAQDMAALATDSLSLAFGDFRAGYQIVDRIGIRTLRDPFTAKPYVVFYSTKRTGAGVLDFEAIKFIKFSA